MGYIYLAIAIVAEVIATSAVKASDGFTKLVPSVIVVAGLALAFYCLSLVFKTIPMGIAYAIWSGLGIVLISVVGFFKFYFLTDRLFTQETEHSQETRKEF